MQPTADASLGLNNTCDRRTPLPSPFAEAASVINHQFLWISLITAGALALRLYRIDWQSSWADENFSLALAGRSFDQMMAGVIRDAVHPPLHYIFLWFWVRLVGFGQMQSRLLSTLFGTLSVPMMFLVGRRIMNPRAGFIAAVLLTISQLGVSHSQEGRMYAMAFFLALCATYFFVRMLQSRRARDWGAFIFFSVLMLYTHYYTLTVLLAFGVFVVVYRKEYTLPRTWIILTPVILGLAMLPWLTSGVVTAFVTRGDVNRDPGFMRFDWTRPITSLNWFNNGKWRGLYLESPWWSLPAGLFLFTLPALAALRPFHRLRITRDVEQVPGAGVLLLLLWIIPMLIVCLIAWLTGTQYDVRYVVYGMAGYLLIAALGFDSLRPAAGRALVLAAAFAYSAGSLYAVYHVQFKTDFRSASQYVINRFQPGDCLCFLPASRKMDFPVYWYVHGRSMLEAPMISADQLIEGRYPCNRVWMLRDQAWFRDQSRANKMIPEFVQNNEIAEQKGFFGIDITMYRPR